MPNIFISSTFEDLNDIRNYISRNIRTALNDFAAMYGEEYTFTDLRLGVENNEKESETICKCLVRLQEAPTPFPFISILGNRYGWVPKEDDLNSAKDELAEKKDYAQIVESLNRGEKGISITQMEINYGAYGLGCKTEKERQEHRDRSVFIVSGDSPEPKQQALIQEIERDFPDQVIYLNNYAQNGISPLKNPDFHNHLLGKCIKILSHAPRDTKLSPEEVERKLHEDYLTLKASGFYGREKLLSQVKGSVSGADKPNANFVYIYGESGIGKSSILSKLAWELRKEINVFPVFCGLTKSSDSAHEILLAISDHLKSQLPSYSKVKKDVVDEYNDVVDKYNQICELYNECKITSPIVIVIDAIDQLRPDAYAQTLAFLPRKGYKKIRVLFSGTYDSEYVESKIFTFKSKDIATFQAYKLGEIERTEISGIVDGIFSTELRVGEVPNSLCDYLEKNSITNPLYLAIVLQKLSLMSIEEMRHTQAGGKKETNFTREEALIKIIEDFVEENTALASLETLCIQFLKSWSDQFDDKKDDEKVNKKSRNKANKKAASFFDIARYIAESRHGLPISVIKNLYDGDFNEELFYVFCFSLNRFFIKRRDGSIDFTHKCLRNALKAYTREQEETDKMQKDIFRVLKKEKDSHFKDAEICYHALLSNENAFIYRYVAQNTLKITDNPKEKELKHARLKFLGEIIKSVDYVGHLFDYSRWQYNDNASDYPNIAFLQFCLNMLPDSFHISYEETKRMLNILEYVVIAYSYPLLSYNPENKEYSYKIEPSFNAKEYFKTPPKESSIIKTIVRDYCPSSIVYNGIEAVKKVWEFKTARKYQFGINEDDGNYFDTDYSHKINELHDLEYPHLDLFLLYAYQLCQFYHAWGENNFSITDIEVQNFWQEISRDPYMQSIIYRLNEKYYFRDKNEHGDIEYMFYMEQLDEFLNDSTKALWPLREKEKAPRKMLDNLILAVNTYNSTKKIFEELNNSKAEHFSDPERFEQERKKLFDNTDSNKISDTALENYVVFLEESIERYDELNSGRKSLEECFTYYQESYDFLCDYLRYYGFHHYAYNALKKCVYAAEKAGISFEKSKEYRLGAARVLTNMISYKFTQKFSILEPFFLYNEDTAQFSEAQKEELDFERMLCESTFLKKNIANVSIIDFSNKYPYFFREFLKNCSKAYEFCIEHVKYKANASRFEKEFYSLLDEFLFFYEKRKLVAPNKSLIDWILKNEELVFVKEKSFNPYRDDLLSLQQYANEFKYIGYENEQGKYVWDAWEWKRNTRKN